MKNTFKKYHIKSSDELKELLVSSNTLFVFDTCVLLDFFRCTKDTRNELQNIFEQCEDKLYMPYQIGKEFYKNRHNIIPDIDEQVLRLIHKLKGTINEIKKFSKSTYFLASLVESVNNSISKSIRNISGKQKNFHSTIKEEEICSFFEQVFLNKVGNKRSLTDEQKDDFKNRVSNGTPPGEIDSKNKNFPYGDYIIWLDIIQKSIDTNKDIIFITSETKTDWFYKVKRETIIAPRAELLEEFETKTGRTIHIYNIANFVEDWHRLAKIDKIPSKAISELRRMFNEKEPNNSEVNNKQTEIFESNILSDDTATQNVG